MTQTPANENFQNSLNISIFILYANTTDTPQMHVQKINVIKMLDKTVVFRLNPINKTTIIDQSIH